MIEGVIGEKLFGLRCSDKGGIASNKGEGELVVSEEPGGAQGRRQLDSIIGLEGMLLCQICRCGMDAGTRLHLPRFAPLEERPTGGRSPGEMIGQDVGSPAELLPVRHGLKVHTSLPQARLGRLCFRKAVTMSLFGTVSSHALTSKPKSTILLIPLSALQSPEEARADWGARSLYLGQECGDV